MLAKRFRSTLRRQRLRFLLVGSPAFGSTWHRFERGARCSAEQVSAFEARSGISLPSDFKDVLREVGDGCPGPYSAQGELSVVARQILPAPRRLEL